jgi:23S rRNA pseudouridine955/2504/2580 synthase
MEYRTFTLGKDDDARRIDRILRKFLPDTPLSAIYRLIRRGSIRVNDLKVKPDSRVYEGQTLAIASSVLPSSPSSLSSPRSRLANLSPYPVLCETPDVVFVDKPAGIAVHGPDGMSERMEHLAGSLSLSFQSGPLHRLDKDTTGIIAFSKSLLGARWFTKALGDRSVGKEYLGIVEGSPLSYGMWEDLDDEGRPMRTETAGIGQASIPGLGVVSFVSFRILTGRKHQIRIGASRRGHPLLGDSRYGGTPFPYRESASFFLHAWRLTLPEERPAGLPDILVAPIPERFSSFLREFFDSNLLALIDSRTLY